MSRETTLGVAAALPGLIWAVVLVVVVLLGVRSFEPAPLTLSEAAALRDNADVLLLVRQGADPNAPAAIRPEVLSSRTGAMTPLEAAVAARHVETARLLVELGAIVGDDNSDRLYCFAARSRLDELIGFVEARRPGRGEVDCDTVSMP